MPDSHHDILEAVVTRVFPPDSRLLSAAGASTNFLIIGDAEKGRWILPVEAGPAMAAVRARRPLYWHSKLLWFPFLSAYRYRFLHRLPLVGRLSVETPAGGDWSHLGWPAGNQPTVAVHVGGARSNQKAVVFLGDTSRPAPEFVTKVPLAPDAAEGILREARVLRFLREHESIARGVPRILHEDPVSGIASQEFVRGRMPGYELGPKHLDLLCGLAEHRECVSLSSRVEQMVSSFSDHLVYQIRESTQASEFLRQMSELPSIPSVVTHGDFNPWNLLYRPDGSLAALDWEYGDTRGLPTVDLVQLLVTIAHRARRQDVPGCHAAVGHALNSASMRRYLSVLGLEPNTLDCVASYAFLRSLLMWRFADEALLAGCLLLARRRALGNNLVALRQRARESSVGPAGSWRGRFRRRSATG